MNPFLFWLSAMAAATSSARPARRGSSVLAGEITSLTVSAIPDRVVVRASGPETGFFHEMDVAAANRLRLDIEDALIAAILASPDAAERRFLAPPAPEGEPA